MRLHPKQLLATAAIGIGCSTPTAICGCPPALGIGFVSGVVSRSTGAPVPGAAIDIGAGLSSCTFSGSGQIVDRPTTSADSTGRYSYLIRALGPSDSACVRITARDPSRPADTAVVHGIRMRLASSYGTHSRPDSIRVDFTLP